MSYFEITTIVLMAFNFLGLLAIAGGGYFFYKKTEESIDIMNQLVQTQSANPNAKALERVRAIIEDRQREWNR